MNSAEIIDMSSSSGIMSFTKPFDYDYHNCIIIGNIEIPKDYPRRDAIYIGNNQSKRTFIEIEGQLVDIGAKLKELDKKILRLNRLVDKLSG